MALLYPPGTEHLAEPVGIGKSIPYEPAENKIWYH